MAREMHQKAGEPEDVAVYHEFTKDGHNLFYFSPGSLLVFFHLLKFFEASSCDKPASFEHLTRVLGPIIPSAEDW